MSLAHRNLLDTVCRLKGCDINSGVLITSVPCGIIRINSTNKMIHRYLFFHLLLWLSLTLVGAFGIHSSPRTTPRRPSSSNAAARSPLFRARPSTINVVSFRGGGSVDSSTIPVFPKSPEEYNFIREALLENVMFTTLPKDTLDNLIYAFERIAVNKDDVIITQGDICDGGDYVYLVAEGKCKVIVDGKVVPEPYGTIKGKAILGELGVLYNQTRSATIVAKSDAVSLFRVNADTFKSVLNKLTVNDDPELLQQIDNAINQVEGTKSFYGGDIIRQYKSNRSWLWRRWRGTVFEQNWRTVGYMMLYSLFFTGGTRLLTDPTWKFGLIPDKTHPFIIRLDIIRKIWNYQMSLTTFILTFFVQKAYTFWLELYNIGRRIQGRFNDIGLLLATGAKRNPDGTFTHESEKLLDDVAASSRLLHALFWSSCARRFSVLGTSRGLERMASRGLMTSQQLRVLESLDLPANQRHNACLEWMMIRAWQGIDDGTLRSETSFSDRLMDQICQLRASYATIGDKLACRMPLSYTHLVQILVDSFIVLTPVALYPDLGAYSIFSVGVLTLFYTGLLDLAKVFLDPLDNEDFTKNNIDMDLGVFIRESNGGSTRWKNSGSRLPFSIRSPPPPPNDSPPPPKEPTKLD